MRSQSRTRFLKAIAAVGLAAVVGGVVAGFLLRAQEDVGLAPSFTPAATSLELDSESPGPSFTLGASATSTASPTATAAPTASPTASPTQTPAPTATPVPTPAATSRPTPTPTPNPIAWESVAEGPDVFAGGISDSAIGPDGRLYSFFWGGRVPNRGRESGTTPVLVFDPTDGSVEFRNPVFGPLGTDAQAVTGGDGLIYFFVWGADVTSVHAYDPAADAFIPEAEAELPIVVWDAAAIDGRIYLTAQSSTESPIEIYSYDAPTQAIKLVASHDIEHQAMIANADGELVFIGSDGTFAFDVGDRSVRQVAPAHDWDVLSKRAEAAGPRDTLLVADRGVTWYHDGSDWIHVPSPQTAEVLSFLDSRWVMITVEPTGQNGPLVIEYWQAEQAGR